MKFILSFFSFLMMHLTMIAQVKQMVPLNNEQLYRPVFHFTPSKGWMNDPNGLIYLNGQYHLFYQHYPDSTVWGPMHWGHATSKDLVQWAHQPIALYPDSIGMIFSGSAVLDQNNTSGLGRNGIAPLVAIYTQHNMPGEKSGRTDFQNQSIAYSLDEGKSWIKYAGNPVLKTPNLKDFRDPKVIWHEPTKKWIMSLAVANHVEFYSSANLIQWTKESSFGQAIFAQGGVWECPDLLSFNVNGKTVWVLLVSMNPGGPNSGSATQYMVGDFDGHRFTPFTSSIKWMDYGPDNYAGVTFSNLGDRKVLIGWMSNWNYANVVPTEKWRSALTIPRTLGLIQMHTNSSEYILTSTPVKELVDKFKQVLTKENVLVNRTLSVVSVGEERWKDSTASNLALTKTMPHKLALSTLQISDFEIVFSNAFNEKLLVGFDAEKKQFYINRKNAGLNKFYNGFAATPTAPRFAEEGKMDLTLFLDKTSIELFADGGRTVMTSLFFPTHPFTRLMIQSKAPIKFEKIALSTF